MSEPLRILVVSTPVGWLGSGRGGGVELTLASAVAGLLQRGHHLTVLAAEGSRLPPACAGAQLWFERGVDQPSWQHQNRDAAVVMPADGLLPRLWQRALATPQAFDLVLNMAYDWLPLWLTPLSPLPLFHLVSMGSVAAVMDDAIGAVARSDQRRLAFHTGAQASDFSLPHPPRLVGNGFDLGSYRFLARATGGLGWVGRVAPEKGLEDAAAAAARLGERLTVWGVVEDPAYGAAVEAAVPPGTLHWRGFLPTDQLQAELGPCRVLLNTPKWNEAYGNVVVEALACGVPVVAYNRGGPGELVQDGLTGHLVPPDDVDALTAAVAAAGAIDRRACRAWVEREASLQAFAERLECWFREGLGR